MFFKKSLKKLSEFNTFDIFFNYFEIILKNFNEIIKNIMNVKDIFNFFINILKPVIKVEEKKKEEEEKELEIVSKKKKEEEENELEIVSEKKKKEEEEKIKFELMNEKLDDDTNFFDDDNNFTNVFGNVNETEKFFFLLWTEKKDLQSINCSSLVFMLLKKFKNMSENTVTFDDGKITKKYIEIVFNIFVNVFNKESNYSEYEKIKMKFDKIIDVLNKIALMFCDEINDVKVKKALNIISNLFIIMFITKNEIFKCSIEKIIESFYNIIDNLLIIIIEYFTNKTECDKILLEILKLFYESFVFESKNNNRDILYDFNIFNNGYWMYLIKNDYTHLQKNSDNNEREINSKYEIIKNVKKKIIKFKNNIMKVWGINLLWVVSQWTLYIFDKINQNEKI